MRLRLLLFTMLFASPLWATTHYISTSGSDSNSGTSTASPWLHIPGSGSCTANCATYTPVAGDNFIFKGGEVWHVSTGAIGYTPITYSGNGTDCDVRNGKTSTCIYIGVDKTWFSGGAWTRPIIDWDNPLSTSVVTSCAHPDNFNGGSGYIFNVSGSYVTLDNFELRGWCQGDYGAANINFAQITGSYDTVENMYQHGWTHTATCTGGKFCEDDSLVYGNSTNVQRNSYIYNNTLNGSDSSPGQGSLCKYECAYVVNNTVRYATQAVVSVNAAQFSGNWIDNVENPWDSNGNCANCGSHGNVLETTSTVWAQNIYVYNNLLSNSVIEVGYWMSPSGGATLYFFNNVIYGISGDSTINCVLFSNSAVDTSSNNYRAYNNSIESPCGVRYTTNNADFGCPRGNAYWTDSLAIGYASFPGQIDAACVGLIAITYTTDYTMPSSEATTYSFTDANKLKGSSTDTAVKGTGTNLTTSCTGGVSSLCSDVEGALWYGGSYLSRPTGSTAWDIGAYVLGTAPPTAATPSCTPGSGNYALSQSVTCSDSSAGAIMCYTRSATMPAINGGTTCASGTQVSGTILISASGPLNVVAGGTGYGDSAVASYSYVIGPPAPALRMLLTP